MLTNAGRISTRFFLFALVMGGLTLTSAVALAATVEGCDPKVETDHQAKAQVRTAVDVNGTEGISQKPDSTAAMTCFNVLAGNDAGGSLYNYYPTYPNPQSAPGYNPAYGGSIFSGDFSGQTGYKTAIEDALQNFYGTAAGNGAFLDSAGKDSGMVNYTSGVADVITPNATAPCGGMSDAAGTSTGLWPRVKLQGIAQGDPSVTSLQQLLTGSLSGAENPNVKNDKINEQSTDQDNTQYSNAQTALTPPAMQTIGAADPFCQTLIDANIPQAACVNGE